MRPLHRFPKSSEMPGRSLPGLDISYGTKEEEKETETLREERERERETDKERGKEG